ncbi:hypothetical protein CAL7716_035570 [Calothrix sp. PCC 7716]|nr:hypothetical protein CAL7716_035570 [Calothrix sp. PCC 7716]
MYIYVLYSICELHIRIVSCFMKAKVYVETSVISYLTSRPSRDVVIAGHQQTTRDWWENCRETFNIVVS